MEEVKIHRQNEIVVLPPFNGNLNLIWNDTFKKIATANQGMIGFILQRMPANIDWGSVRPLHVAAAYGADNWVKALLEKRANPNSVMITCDHELESQDQFTPLELACAYGHWRCAISLLAHRAEPVNLNRVPTEYGQALQWVFAEVDFSLFNAQQPSPSHRLLHQVYLAACDSLKFDEEAYQTGIVLLEKLFVVDDFSQQVITLAQHFNRSIVTLLGKLVLTPLKERCFDTMLLQRIKSDEALYRLLGINHSAVYYDLTTPTGRCTFRHNIMCSHLPKYAILPIQQWRVDIKAVHNNDLLNYTENRHGSDSDSDVIGYNY